MATETVVVLFTDLVGSTEVLMRVGEPDADRLRRELFALSRAALRNGVEVKNTGDGLMVVFGTPSAAVDAAVRLQQALDVRNRRAEVALELRIGLSMGECDRDTDDYFGRPVVEAARLCARADAGQILTADVVRTLAGSRSQHAFESVGALELKGLDAPLLASSVQWGSLADAALVLPVPARLARVPGAPFVGRDAQCAALLDLFKDAAETGSHRVAFVSGEPGIGKTTLLRETAARVVDAGGFVLYGRCEDELSAPYQPWREALSHLAGHRPDIVEPFADVMGPLLGWDRVGAQADPESERYLLFTTTVDLLAWAAEVAPLLVVLDDLHWADAPTVALLRHVLTTPAPLRVLVVGTFRDADLGADHPLVDMLAALHREEHVERLALVGLGDTDVLALLEALAGHQLGDDGVALRDALLAETTGNPFFLVEILRHLAETGAIVQTDTGRWETSADLRSRGLPISVREVIMRRVDRLGPETRRALEFASVIGHDFALDLLAPVLDRDVDETLDVLEPAVAASLVTDIEPGHFAFAHALTGHALYDGLTPTRRARAHALVASTLERQLGESPGPRAAELAHHWAQATTAQEPLKALASAVKAGEYALDQLAPNDAARWFDRALELARDASDPDGIRWRTAALVGLGAAQRQIGVAGFREPLFEAARLARALGDDDLLVRAALATSRGYRELGVVNEELVELLTAAVAVTEGEQSPRHAQLLIVLALEILHHEPERARELALQSLEMARALEDPETHVVVATGLPSSPHTATLRKAFVEEAIPAARKSGNPALLWMAMMSRATIAFEQGDTATIDECLSACAALAERLGQPSLHWKVQYAAAERAVIAGEFERAEQLANQALETGRASGQPDADAFYAATMMPLRFFQGRGGEVIDQLAQVQAAWPEFAAYRYALAAAYASLDRPDDARALIARELAKGFSALVLTSNWALDFHVLGECVVYLGDSRAAHQIYDLVEPYADMYPGSKLCSYDMFHLLLARLAATFGDLDRADAHFADAHVAHEWMGAAYSLAKTQAAWADMLVRRGTEADVVRARELATSALAAAERGGYRWVERDATAVLARLD